MTPPFHKTALIAASSILLLAAGPKADLNQDGQVTKSEFAEAAKVHFLAADTNSDSFLSEDERKAARSARMSKRKDRRFDRLDADGDGAISRAEMDAAGAKRKSRRTAVKEKMLERFDTNFDGELSKAERTAMKAEIGGKRKRRFGKRGKRPKPDANGDGFVSLDEHMTVSEQLFTRLDANADGVLTKGEGRKRRKGGR